MLPIASPLGLFTKKAIIINLWVIILAIICCSDTMQYVFISGINSLLGLLINVDCIYTEYLNAALVIFRVYMLKAMFRLICYNYD